MEEQYVETIVSTFIGELLSSGKSLLSEIGDEGKALLRTNIKKYLDKQKSKYSYLKTLLRGNTPVYLYEIFYPIKLDFDGQVVTTDSVASVFEKSNYLTIIGDAGSGKSTLVKHLFLNSIFTKYAIPILIELRYLNDYQGSFHSYIIERILECKIEENNRIIERILEKGKFVFFLDGYDELSKDIKISVIQSVNSFVNQYIENKFVLTTRPHSDIENLPLFHNCEVMPLSLDDGEIEGFVYKQLPTELELATKIVNSIKSNNSAHIHSFLSNPLLLSLYILTFQSNASIPSKKCIFYRRVINALFSEHDSKTKLGYVREKVSGLDQEQFEEILKKFCFISYFESRFDWDVDYIYGKFKLVREKAGITFENNKVITDLKSAISLWVEDNGIYSFAHRSLQEYFAAQLVSNLNILEKERVYEKILNKFSKIKKVNETTNFLSLLEEMDGISFKKYYYLPLLKELRIEIKSGTDRELVESLLNFFALKIQVPVEDMPGLNRIWLNFDKVYRSIYVHIEHTQELYGALLDIMQAEKEPILNCQCVKMKVFKEISNEAEVGEIKLNKELSDEIINIFYGKLLPIAQKFSKFIDQKIEESENAIRINEENDRDLVSLI